MELHPRLRALTLEIILRAVFGLDPGPRLEALRDRLSQLLAYGDRPITLLPPRPRGWSVCWSGAGQSLASSACAKRSTSCCSSRSTSGARAG